MTVEIKKYFTHKKTLLLIVGIAFLILLMPTKPAEAGFWSWISGITTAVPSMVISFVIFIFGALASLFAGFAGMILSFVIGPNFTALSYTNPATNPVIKLGLGATQGLANIILVLILIYIALATILRLAGYETKKILPKFVVVALLVNFTPVLCGLIVDASNIIMNYFAQPLIGAGGLSSLVMQLKDMWSMFAAGFDVDVLVSSTAQLSQIFKLLAATIFYYFLALILLLYAGVFVVRYVAIWILVILSPIAFVCMIMPKGSPVRRGWDMWWSQFIQWCIIGILKMFFLYLGIQLMVQAPNLFKGNLGVAELGWFTMILPYVVPLAFLYLGWIMSMQTTAFGASAVIGLAKKSGRWVGGKAWQGTKTWAEEKGHVREATGKAVHAVEKIPVARAFLPQKVREYGQFEPAIAKARGKSKFQSSPELAHRAATGADYGVNAVGNLMEIVERGDSNDWIKTHARQYGIDPDKDKDYEKKLNAIPKYKEKMARLFQIAQQGGQHNTILRSAPRLAEFAKIKGYEGLNRQQAMAKAIEEARPQHVNKWEEEDILDEDVIKPLMSRGRDMWQAVGQVKKGHIGPLRVIGGIYKKDFLDKGKTWEDFEKSYREQEKGGFFDYLKSPRAKEQGWTNIRIRELAGEKITPKVPPTPGEAAGIKVVTPIGATKRTEEEIAEKKRIREEVEKKYPRGRPGIGKKDEVIEAEIIEEAKGLPTPPEKKQITWKKKPPRGRGGVGV